MDKFSFLNSAHTSFFAEMYDQYLESPDSLEPSWKAFFQGFDFGLENANITVEEKKFEVPENISKEFKVVNLIDAYRQRGHLFTITNPVRQRRKYSPTLDIENFGLTKTDLDLVFSAGEVVGIGPDKLSNIIDHLQKIYCESIGLEYMYIRDPEKVKWIQNFININGNQPNFSKDEKLSILDSLNKAYTFENFLQKKYVGQKRFSLEGGESLIPAIDFLINSAAEKGIEEFVMGMSHRGRLNTLVNIFGKSSRDIFGEFEGKDYEEDIFDGDVKYHLGWTSERISTSGKKINMNLAPNPSHLESVDPIVQGIARAKLENDFDNNTNKVLPIIVHGDAAIAGQGVVYEVIQMSRLKGYSTGGTIHLIVNNQVGFTTNYLDARSSTYCSDVGKVTLSPVLHVNSDDVEAVIHAVTFALEYRNKFNRDVFIDLLGYRKYGHNEGDEPRFTQPKLYKYISGHPNPRDIYASKLKNQGIINDDHVSKIELEYFSKLEAELTDSKKKQKTNITPFMQEVWEGFTRVDEKKMLEDYKTSSVKKDILNVARSIISLPNKPFLRKIIKLFDSREKLIFENGKVDWAMAELLAYGTLLNEGFNVRISGQDVERGTFSHRHAVLKSEDSEEEYLPLNNVDSINKGLFRIYNSPLSEYGVLGFDYGYALASPNCLTIWEAQFGDFSNGAQIIIDQYISSAEDKWKLQNGIVLYLPHGYEGQGAEHSSARMERYLQLCAKDNMYAANCTTPSNLFHLLRRQMLTKFRKPLILFTPKSLLRHPKVISNIDELTSSKFIPVITDSEIEPDKVDSLVFCSGKFYFDLIDYREKNNIKNAAIVRIEQLFPLPVKLIISEIKKFSNATDIVWAQEEPRNMGAWNHIQTYHPIAKNMRPATRRFYGSTASGSFTRFERRHNQVIEYVFDKTKNNFRK
ncbi:2-oxoglutarate dehydrogenase E1 component [Flavobacteriaceae bacterium]|nr:2-oxoglutarate dehydrogenase E1 component [Flavobacteriaceae bacterium]|tara:strand:- start:326 stop:3079 length:2754 start_codon:yes stop_codon:yes gene_type:complete